MHPTVPPARAARGAITRAAATRAAATRAATVRAVTVRAVTVLAVTVLVMGCVLLALAGAVLPGAWAAPAMASPRSPGLAASAPGAAAVSGRARPQAAAPRRGRAGAVPAARHVVLIGVPGLLWTDVTAARMPALWRLARQGSDGSLSVTGVYPLTCPADGWLTLNAANRAAAPRPPGVTCPPLPAVRHEATAAGHADGSPARIAQLPSIISANAGLSENPSWGLLRAAAGPRACATAAGPGAALALASPAGRVTSYLAGTAGVTRAVLARCPLTVIDLGSLPAGGAQRRAAVAGDDRDIGRISAALPPGTRLVVTAPADGAGPHLHPIVIAGPGYRAGLLTSPSTRQPGLAVLTDLTPTIAGWLGRPVPGTAVGARLGRTARPSLAAAWAGLRRPGRRRPGVPGHHALVLHGVRAAPAGCCSGWSRCCAVLAAGVRWPGRLGYSSGRCRQAVSWPAWCPGR